jgi:hypothetical protein
MNTIAGILVFAWIAIAIVNAVLAWRYTWGLPLTEIPGRTTPPAAVVVAVKNASDVSRAFFGRLRHQAYPDYRIIAPVESEEDPAFAMVTEESKRPRTDHRRRRRPPKPGSSRGRRRKNSGANTRARGHAGSASMKHGRRWSRTALCSPHI